MFPLSDDEPLSLVPEADFPTSPLTPLTSLGLLIPPTNLIVVSIDRTDDVSSTGYEAVGETSTEWLSTGTSGQASMTRLIY